MSYNITNFKVKKLEGLKVPLAALFDHEDENFHPEKEDHRDGNITLHIMETELHGTIKDDWFIFTDIEIYPEWSGIIMEEVLGPAFKKGHGELVATCIWEGGDSTDRLVVKDGKVMWEKVEI